MPCTSNYQDPTHEETNRIEIANHLIYAQECIGHVPSPKLREIANHVYGEGDFTTDELTQQLCKLLGMFSETQLNKIVYDGKKAKARKLADWWEKHQEADRKREEEEAEQTLKNAYKYELDLTQQDKNVMHELKTHLLMTIDDNPNKINRFVRLLDRFDEQLKKQK